MRPTDSRLPAPRLPAPVQPQFKGAPCQMIGNQSPGDERPPRQVCNSQYPRGLSKTLTCKMQSFFRASPNRHCPPAPGCPPGCPRGLPSVASHRLLSPAVSIRCAQPQSLPHITKEAPCEVTSFDTHNKFQRDIFLPARALRHGEQEHNAAEDRTGPHPGALLVQTRVELSFAACGRRPECCWPAARSSWQRYRPARRCRWRKWPGEPRRAPSCHSSVPGPA